MWCEGKPSRLSMCVLGRRKTIARQCPQLNCIGRLAKAEHLAWVDLQHSTGILEMTDLLSNGFEVWLTTPQGLPCSCSVKNKWVYKEYGMIQVYWPYQLRICFISCIFLFTLPTIKLWHFFSFPLFSFYRVMFLYFLGVFVFLFFYFLPLLQCHYDPPSGSSIHARLYRPMGKLWPPYCHS